MNKKKVIYIGLLIIVSVIVTITCFSYAFLTRTDEQHGKLNIVAGTLEYKIESDDLENNSITLSGNDATEIEITIKSLNKIASKYQLYTNNVENVEVGYLEDGDPSIGTISSDGTKVINIVLRNNSNESKTITFGVQGGFENKDISLEDNRVAVDLGEGLCVLGTIYEFPYTGNIQTFISRCNGAYKLEAWGAEGGGPVSTVQGTPYDGGKGGYASGVFTFSKDDIIYIHVGGKPAKDVITGGYNGGGNAAAGTDINDGKRNIGSPGGGATDFRIENGSWNNESSLRSRIVVAGGGGGTGQYVSGPGGAGGGLTGIAGSREPRTSSAVAQGGTQTAGGAKSGCCSSPSCTSYCNPGPTNGGFGFGGNSCAAGWAGGAGGGGWYGGGGGAQGYVFTGAGGSSYVSGHTGCVSVTSKTNSTPKSGCVTGTSDRTCSISPYGYESTNSVIIDGQGYSWTNQRESQQSTQMPNPSGGLYALGVGHTGNGYAKITYLGKKIVLNADGGTLSETIIYRNNRMGTLPTPTKNHYTFIGWYTSDNKLINENTRVNDLPSLTITAHYAPITYVVTFNTNGGTVSEPTRVVNSGQQIGTLPTPTKDGRTFLGWYTDTNYTTKVTNTYVITKDTIFYARYSYNLALINNVGWTTYHSGNASETRGMSGTSYLFQVRGAQINEAYDTHRFTTNLISISEPTVLSFSYNLLKDSSYASSGEIIVYDASNNALFRTTTVGTGSKTINVPAGGFKIYLNYYAPGNWFGNFQIDSIISR